MFISQDELKTNMRPEEVNLLSRGDSTLVDSAISRAIDLTKGYLSRFDTDQIFGATGAQRSDLVVGLVKDIATYYLCTLGGVGADYDRKRDVYDAAISSLRDIQRGEASFGLPEKANPEEPGKSGLVYFSSNRKRTQHF